MLKFERKGLLRILTILQLHQRDWQRKFLKPLIIIKKTKIHTLLIGPAVAIILMQNSEEDKEVQYDVYGIKYLEMILKDKSFAKGTQINSNKIQAEINQMRAGIKVSEWDLNSNLLKLIFNEKEEDLISELEQIRFSKNTDQRDDSNTNINKDWVMNTSINANTLHENKRKINDRINLKSETEYKYSVLMWFWFALHMEKVSIILRLSELEDIVDRVILNLIKKYNLYLEIEQNESVSESNDEINISKTKVKLQK